MEEIIYVHTGEVKLGRSNDVLYSTPIGSCVVITAWAARVSVGAMAHVMLPGEAPSSTPQPYKYAKNAIDRLVELMIPFVPLTETGVCLLGAANVLKKKDDTICDSNRQSIRAYLDKREIPVHAAVLGGYLRRSTCLCVSSGALVYTQAGGAERLLWQFEGETVADQSMEGALTYARRTG
jgi:chemotaxis receptor (MCP) glutamine deamidase CheD